MRVIARKTLKRFADALAGGKDQRAVKSALDSWFHEAVRAEWKTPADVVRSHAEYDKINVKTVNYGDQAN